MEPLQHLQQTKGAAKLSNGTSFSDIE